MSLVVTIIIIVPQFSKGLKSFLMLRKIPLACFQGDSLHFPSENRLGFAGYVLPLLKSLQKALFVLGSNLSLNKTAKTTRSLDSVPEVG